MPVRSCGGGCGTLLPLKLDAEYCGECGGPSEDDPEVDDKIVQIPLADPEPGQDDETLDWGD